MKAEVTLTKRPRSGVEGQGKVRYLDLNLNGWTENGMTNGSLDNGRMPHGGYKGLMRHPMSIHSFNKGPEYHQHLQQDRQVWEQEQQEPSPTWALKVHTLPTHSGESPLLSGRLLSASKHEAINGRLRPEKESPRATRSATTPRSNKKTSYYRPNSTHQYLTATELKDASDCDEVLKYGRPTRTTLLRARHRASSATNSALEARRQKEQRIAEMKKVSAFCGPEEVTPVYSDSEDQSFYSFLLGARYNRAHCLDSKSLVRHGVYMPRNNPLGCFVITDKPELEGAPATADSPRSDAGLGPRPQLTERQQQQQRRPTTAPSYGRKTSARATRTPRTPRTARTPRQAWGDVTVSLHVANGTKQTFSFSKEGSCKFEARLPVVHGTSLAKLHRFKEPPSSLEDPTSSNAQQPPPSPILSARGGGQDPSQPPTAPNSLADPLPHPQPLPQLPSPHPQPHPADATTTTTTTTTTEAIDQVRGENRDPTATEEGRGRLENNLNEAGENDEDKRREMTRHEEEGGGGGAGGGGGGGGGEGLVSGEERVTEGEGEGGEKRDGEKEMEVAAVEEEEEKGDVMKTEEGVDEGEKEEEGEGGEEKVAVEKESGDNPPTTAQVPDDETTHAANDVTQHDVTESQPPETGREENPSDTAPPAAEEEDQKAEVTKDEDNVLFFVTEQDHADHQRKNEEEEEEAEGGDSISNTAEKDDLEKDPPQEDHPPGETSRVEEDAASTASSKKSLSKRVSFKIPPVEDPGSDADVVPVPDKDENTDQDMEEDEQGAQHQAAGDGAEVLDSDLDEPGQGQGEGEEPLRVIVTHIEKSLGAPVSKDSEGEVIAKHP